MKRKTFLTITAVVATAVGIFAFSYPEVMLASVKYASPSDSANVMARTAGIMFITIGVLDFLVRNEEDSPTMRSILIANLILQLGIIPIDPMAYAHGVFHTLGSFVPNTILHIVLASGFVYFLAKMKRNQQTQTA